MKQKLKQLDKTTWKQIAKDNPKDRIDIEVGDSKQPDFYPQVKIMRWDNECNYSIRLIDDNTGSVKQEGDKVIYDKQDKKIEFYEVDDSYKMVWFLKEKPKSNKVEFTIQSKGVEFYYQPELTEEEKKTATRPENVVGSYAVYASEQKTNYVGGKEYKCGKIGHIYRPHLYDAEGKEAWGDLHIEDGIYSVTIPQEFLDKAIYPIKSNDTFGYETVGSSSDGTSDMIIGSYFTGVAGTGVSITAYRYLETSTDNKCALYSKSGDTATYVQTTGTVKDSGERWELYNFSSAPELSAVDYWLFLWVDDEYSPTVTTFYDSGTTGQGLYQYDGYGTWATTIDTSGANDHKYSIYATYTTGTDVTASPTVVTSTFTHPTATITGDALYSSTTQSLDFSIPTITVIVPFITPYNAFFKNIANGGIDLDTNTIRVALVTSDYTFDRDAHEYFDDITNEITGTGYTAKGTELTGKSVVESGGQGVFDANNASWSNASFTARGAVVYRDTGTASTSPLIYFLDFAEDKVLSEENFVLVWQDSGIINSS